MALLTCSDVTFSYEGIPVLTDVNFALEAGSYLCIVGENGSGKSTLIKGLLHLKNPSTGSITTGDGPVAITSQIPHNHLWRLLHRLCIYARLVLARWSSESDHRTSQVNVGLTGHLF